MVPKTTLSNYIWSELKKRVVDLLIVPMYLIFKGHVIAKLNRISALNNNIFECYRSPQYTVQYMYLLPYQKMRVCSASDIRYLHSR
jgi:hypothetical protein